MKDLNLFYLSFMSEKYKFHDPDGIYFMIVSSEKNDLSSIFADFKKYTSRQIVQLIKESNESGSEWLLRGFSNAGKNLSKVSNYKVWQEGNHPILLDTAKLVSEKLDYIHMNPVEDEIVNEPGFYWYSSARNYEGQIWIIECGSIGVKSTRCKRALLECAFFEGRVWH